MMDIIVMINLWSFSFYLFVYLFVYLFIYFLLFFLNFYFNYDIIIYHNLFK